MNFDTLQSQINNYAFHIWSLRFDVLQDNEDDNQIHLYEIYQDDAAVEAHRNAPHYVKWREECKDWFATENVRRLATPVYPPPEKWEKRAPVD